MLEVRGLTVSYGQHRALEGVALDVRRGEIVVILGANGAGKSTALKAISGICEGRVRGTVTMQGEAITGLPARRIVEAGIALVPEGRGVFADLTVAENLALGGHPARARDEAAGNLDRVLSLFPRLAERKRQVVRTMSGGEQQMVAIGRAMMSNPALLTPDEPSLGLSPLLSKELFQNLKRVRDTGIGILLVEQNARASLAIADRGYLLENGRIVHSDSADRLRNDPAVQAAYLGGGGARRPIATAAVPRPATEPLRPVTPTVPRLVTGPTPADTAAAAIAGLVPATPVRPAAPVVQPVMAPAPQPQLMPYPAPPRAAAPPRPTAVPLFGLALDNVVADAAAASRAGYGTTPPPRASSPRPAAAAATVLPPTGSAMGADRLKAALAEIEQAAAAARAWRPDPRRNNPDLK